MNFLIFWIIAFTVSYLTTPLLRRLAIALRIMDLPGGRKIHHKATPLLGGVAIYLGVVTVVFSNMNDYGFFIPVLIGGTIMLGVGLLDDLRGLGARFRLVCQLIAAGIVIASGIRINFLPHSTIGIIGEMILTFFWIIGVTNAYNYLDGMDGLAAGSAVINLFCFEVILYMTNQSYLGILAVILTAACLGFLPQNFRKKKKMFLGDSGSTFLGFSIACMALIGAWAEDNIVKISIPILILGVPIFDMIFTTVMRIKEGKVKNFVEWLEYGGRDHFHHYLVDVGLTHIGAVVFIYFITISLGISAIMVSNDKAFEGVLVLFQAAIIFGIIATLIVLGKKRRIGRDVEKN